MDDAHEVFKMQAQRVQKISDELSELAGEAIKIKDELEKTR